MCLDPLQVKYPQLSPYIFTDNNPILFLDYDGEDYGVKIDNVTKTITIVATVYTAKIDLDEANDSANHWVGQNGKYQVEVSTVIKPGIFGFGRKVSKELFTNYRAIVDGER